MDIVIDRRGAICMLRDSCGCDRSSLWNASWGLDMYRKKHSIIDRRRRPANDQRVCPHTYVEWGLGKTLTGFLDMPVSLGLMNMDALGI